MSLSASDAPPSSAQLLRLAVQNLACHPQSQRRYVQLGWMDRAIANLAEIAADLSPLVEAGEVKEEDAAQVVALRDTVNAALERRPDLLQVDHRQPRAFLFSNALEDDDWNGIRQLARALHRKLSGDRSVFVSIMAH
jgi:hypothetical protein